MFGLRIGTLATWSTVRVFSLSDNPYVGTPPNARRAASTQATTVGNVLSRIGRTTRKRHHDNQAQNNVDFTPCTTGPSP
jgi:hypothetical protein